MVYLYSKTKGRYAAWSGYHKTLFWIAVMQHQATPIREEEIPAALEILETKIEDVRILQARNGI